MVLMGQVTGALRVPIQGVRSARVAARRTVVPFMVFVA